MHGNPKGLLFQLDVEAQAGRMNIYCKAISLQRAELLRPHLHNYLARWPAQARGKGEKLNFLKSKVSIVDLP